MIIPSYAIRIIFTEQTLKQRFFNILQNILRILFFVICSLLLIVIGSIASYYTNCFLCGAIIVLPGSLLLCSLFFS